MSQKNMTKLGAIAGGLVAGAFLSLSAAAIVIAVTYWGWK